MPLLRLEVENFKSYRGKQIIGPFRSFNSVIGPNGSGKSNLMDAISFVLGVKSSQLRSSQLKQLIYRRGRLQDGLQQDIAEQDTAPEEHNNDGMDIDDEEGNNEQNAGNSKTMVPQRATVVAVYEDQKGAEHRFQRSVSANGASEYRVNGRAMNAGAYNERLKSFNILVKAKNFLVFQGDVEAVAAQNPKDLSRLIDQISGSLEHKEAYDAAKTLQAKTHEELNHTATKRRNIMVELRHFRDQLGEADRHTRLQRDKHNHTVRHMLWTLFHADRSIKDLVATVARKNQALSEQREELAEAEAEVNEARQAHGTTMQSILDQQRSMRKREKEADKVQPDIDAEEQKILHSERRIANAQEIVKAVEKDLEKYNKSLVALRDDREKTREAARLATEEQARASAKGGLRLSEADTARFHELRAVASQRKTDERQSLIALKREIRAQETGLTSLKDKLAALEAQDKKVDEESRLVNEMHEGTLRRRRDAQDRLRAIREADNSLRKRKENTSKEIVKLNETLAECLGKLNEAGTYQRETEKQARMKDTIQSLQRLFPGVRGRVVDLCRPTQRKYELAVATVLGKNADAIVVNTQKEAIECIEYMKRQRVGQATFIPLETAQVKDINERLRSIAPGARLAFDIIEYDSSVERAMRYACGNALVCDSLDISRHICFEKRQQVKTVTLEGTVIHKSGMMSGGQSSEASNARWEEREIEALKRQRDQSLSEIKHLGSLQSELAREQGNIDKLAQFEAEIASLEDDLSSSSKKAEGLKAEKRVLQNQLKELRPKVDASQRTFDEKKKDANRLQHIVNEDDDVVFADFCRKIGVADIREYEERHLLLLQKQDEAKREYENQLKRLEHVISFEEGRLDEARARRDANARSMAKYQSRLTDLQGEQKELKAKLETIRAEIETARSQLEETQRQEADEKQRLKNAQRRTESVQAEIDTLNRDITSANTEIEHFGSQRRSIFRQCRLDAIELPLLSGSVDDAPIDGNDTTLGIDIETTDESMGDEELADSGPDYGIRVDYAGLTAQEKRDGSEAMRLRLVERIESTVWELERTAAPNAKAQERFGDSESRLADAESAFDRARRDNKRAQEEYTRLRKIRCDLYHRAFDHISAKVDEVYRDLTSSKAAPNGGNAYLDLMNDAEPYLDGVHYTAMPPTKSFRGIDQLSGGEKSVAALALLFAIHSYRPAPFFVLDEVDAALDAQNVARVAAYIRAHASAEFQFIVISLKAMLYEKSETLLGVMRSPAINSSKTLTLDLEQYA